MIDILTMVKNPGESKEDFIKRVIVAVDKNWVEIRTIKIGESLENHYKRFTEYKETPEFICYIMGFRDGESPSEMQARHALIKKTEGRFKYGKIDDIFKFIVLQKESPIQKFVRFSRFEEEPFIDDIVKERVGFETHVQFRVRFLNYNTIKTKIVEDVKKELHNELTRIEADVKAKTEQETLEDWKLRVEGIIKKYNIFITNPRRDVKDNMRLETHEETGNRVKFYQKHLLDIERKIIECEAEEKINDPYNKEYQKHQAKQKVVDDALKKDKQESQEKQDIRMGTAKKQVFFGGIVLVIWFCWLGFGTDVTGSVVIFIGVIVGIAFGFHRAFTIKTFKFLINSLFRCLQGLNWFLNKCGMSVTNNRRF